MSEPERTAAPEQQPRTEFERYLMDCAVVTVKRISEATWEVKGPWPQKFYVDDETFKRKFIAL